MKAVNYLIIGLLFLAVTTAVPSYGLERSKRSIITGYAVDVNHYPVTNALIIVDNIKTSIITNEKGFYRVKVKPNSVSVGIISITHGFLEEIINGRTRINFTFPISVVGHDIIPEYKPEEEEINIGYGKVKRKNLTTPVSKIYGTRQTASYNSIFDMLQGTVPGLTVNGGHILIRGLSSRYLSNEPLFVVDGTPVSSIAEIPPQNVESIEVLKGSAAAIYGARGANGVILIDQIGAPPLRDSITPGAARKVPTAETRAATNIKKSTGTLNGIVNANSFPASVAFEFGTTSIYGILIPAAQNPVTGNVPVNVSTEITGLKPGITYHYRIVAANSFGRVTGIDIPFKYHGEVPHAETHAATKCSPGSAQLNGIVNTRGMPAVVAFEFGLTADYGSLIEASQSPVSGPASSIVSAIVPHLKAGTNYHYRIVATNDEGTAYGEDKTFKSEYSLGEYMYGGYIFYIDETGEHGLVCTPSDQSMNAPWAWGSPAPAGATDRAVGTGYKNTADIVLGCPEEGIAARLCRDLEMDGYSDWFLPSVNELFLMYTNLHLKGTGNFKDGFYWSST